MRLDSDAQVAATVKDEGMKLHRQADYNERRDLRVRPYSLFRVKVDATPIRLR